MNVFRNALAATVSILAFTICPARADSLAIGLSSSGSEELKKSEVSDTIRLLAETVRPGETGFVYNATTGELLCTFEVPDNKGYAAPKAKLNRNAACVRSLLLFAENAIGSLDAGTIDLPEFLRLLARNASGAPVETIVIFGSPIFSDPLSPSLSMAGGRVPSDGHISTLRPNSSYSLSGFGKTLDGVAIHFSSEGYSWIVNDEHEYLTRRFWSLSANALGAELVTFHSDRDQVIQRVESNVRQPAERYAVSDSDKLEMIQVRIDNGPYIPIYDRELSRENLSATALADARKVELGIRWDCPSCDIDLYARAFGGADILFFGQTRTREGIFHKDFVQGRDLMNGLETISFSAPIDLNDLLIAANFYAGDAPQGISGEIRLAVDGQTYAGEFEILAKQGNRGAELTELLKAGQSPNDGWVVIDPVTIVTE
ncbi:hypothetical protein FF098_015920 [Parvularcula flava]|uniref:Uncharacterized protein n=1 Tax=Aquisalinus luteolus TaxID=1566827 RepID=A0A8J3A734_9PROT|nr:hypothetical protein [Aquisalinus luteolus]NHK29403.1 hypothetical protein [Aquisalinus luteolus]GGI02055.1 hypothetical protein GCM10011355_34160 [Aquisalinus luteolus]